MHENKKIILFAFTKNAEIMSKLNTLPDLVINGYKYLICILLKEKLISLIEDLITKILITKFEKSIKSGVK